MTYRLAPRIPVAVIEKPGRYVWAVGSKRAEVSRSGTTCWRWRVWEVIGPHTILKGDARTLRTARERALSALALLES